MEQLFDWNSSSLDNSRSQLPSSSSVGEPGSSNAEPFSNSMTAIAEENEHLKRCLLEVEGKLKQTEKELTFQIEQNQFQAEQIRAVQDVLCRKFGEGSSKKQKIELLSKTEEKYTPREHTDNAFLHLPRKKLSPHVIRMMPLKKVTKGSENELTLEISNSDSLLNNVEVVKVREWDIHEPIVYNPETESERELIIYIKFRRIDRNLQTLHDGTITLVGREKEPRTQVEASFIKVNIPVRVNKSQSARQSIFCDVEFRGQFTSPERILHLLEGEYRYQIPFNKSSQMVGKLPLKRLHSEISSGDPEDNFLTSIQRLSERESIALIIKKMDHDRVLRYSYLSRKAMDMVFAGIEVGYIIGKANPDLINIVGDYELIIATDQMAISQSPNPLIFSNMRGLSFFKIWIPSLKSILIFLSPIAGQETI